MGLELGWKTVNTCETWRESVEWAKGGPGGGSLPALTPGIHRVLQRTVSWLLLGEAGWGGKEQAAHNRVGKARLGVLSLTWAGGQGIIVSAASS